MLEDAPRRAVAEFVGTFALIFIGAGSIMAAAAVTEPAYVGPALAHGLVIAIMVSAVGHISGGHFNPAITLGFLVTRRIEPVLALIYWLAQLAGAVAGALLLRFSFPQVIREPTGLGVPQVNVQISSAWGMVLEAVMTFLLVWVVFATVTDPRGTFKSIAGLAIGLTITVSVLMAGPLTGAALNPARAFGPQIVENVWTDAWVWYVGPVIGGALAALAYEWLYLRPARPVPVGPPETGIEEPRPGDAAVS